MTGTSEQIALQEPPLARDERAAARDERFAALVARQARFVFRIAYSVLRNVQDADDAVQETFLKLYRTTAWERAADEKAFLARATWRIAVDHLKRSARNAPVLETPWPGPNPEEEAMASDWNAVIQALIDALPEELRQPLALSSIEELNSREIAEVLGIPEGTVRTRQMRARQILKEKLKRAGAGRYER